LIIIKQDIQNTVPLIIIKYNIQNTVPLIIIKYNIQNTVKFGNQTTTETKEFRRTIGIVEKIDKFDREIIYVHEGRKYLSLFYFNQFSKYVPNNDKNSNYALI